MKKYSIGIDMGTSSVKLILIDQNGKTLSQSGIEYEVAQPKVGWKEIDPEIWYQAARDGLKQLLQGFDSSLVGGIGITGQMHTVVFIDEDGNSIRPALMWNDVRTAEMIIGLKEKIKAIPPISHISGIVSTGSPAANLLWLKENEPEHFARMKHFLIGPDYLVYRLTGAISTDYCEASTSSLYNLEKEEWSEEMRKIIGLPASVYPPVRGSGTVAGVVKKELRDEFSFTEDTKVIVGTGDNPAAAISTGCLIGNYPVLSLGTSGVFVIPREKTDFSRKGKNIKFSMDGEEIVTLVQGVVQSVGSTVDWCMKKVLKTEDFAKEMAAINENHGSRNLIFYPHLVGDKTIYADPNLRGAFIGLGTEVSREDMIVAVLEGICFAVKEVIEEMKVDKKSLNPLKVTGGGAKNKLWMQMLSDILQVRIEQLSGNVGAGLGMALLAGKSCGNIENLSEVSERLICVQKTFEPGVEKKSYYKDKYRRYRKIYRAMKEID